MSLDIDFETRSHIDLTKRGIYVYMKHSSTEALMASYMINGGPMRRWRWNTPCPDDIVEYVTKTKGMISGHNAAFERLLWQLILTPRCGWPEVATDRFRCTAATSAALGLPRSLEALAIALKMTQQKDKEGAALIKFFSMPIPPEKKLKSLWVSALKTAKGNAAEADKLVLAKGQIPKSQWTLRFNEPNDFPEKFDRFHDYCDEDVLTEVAADSRMIPLSDYEQKVYTLDQVINDRGIRIDRPSAISATRLAEKYKRQLDAEMSKVTGGKVKKCTQLKQLAPWIISQGYELDTLAKADILKLLEEDDASVTERIAIYLKEEGIPVDAEAEARIRESQIGDKLKPHVRKALELRQEASKTSVSKLKSMLARADETGRVRHSFIYHRATTGRWQSVGVNFGNMPRPRKIYENAGLDIAQLFETFRSEDPRLIDLLYGPELGRPLDLISDSIRGFLLAAPGKKLIQADYSSIEGCVIAWTSGEDWKVKALHAIFADPSLPDMYRQTAAGIMNMTTDEIHKKHPLRQSVGKVSELALGFAGGVAAFYAMARTYGIDLHALFAPVWANASDERREKAVKRYENNFKLNKAKARELSREAWIACELIKVGWRATNPAIANGWKLREAAAREAIKNPGTVVKALNLSYVVGHGYLFCRLPSQRCLAYPTPKLKDQVWVKLLCTDGTWSDSEVMDRDVAEKLALEGKVKIEGDTSPSITALGVDKTGRKMQRERLYGGILAENDTQAIARDILVNGMFEAEAAGYPVIGHVYDEMFAEIGQDEGDLAAFEKLICRLPASGWADGLPLSAGGWTAKRYKKD